MKKRYIVIAIVAAMLISLMSGVASARFSDTATATMSGRTGYVNIRTWNVTLTDKFQPGDTQYVWLRVHNNGNCPVKILSATIKGLPGYLGVSWTQRPLGQVFKYCQSLYFKFYVHMPATATKPQNQPFSFQIVFYAENVSTTWPRVGP